MTDKQKTISRMPNAVVLLLGLVILVGILSLFLPTGRYEKITIDGRQVVDPNSFHIVDKTPLKFLEFFDSVHQGLGAAGPLIFMILIIGGAIRLFESTGAISGIVAAFARRFGKEKSSWVLVLIFTFFACLGAFPGMLEAAIPFAPLCISIALALGYDVFVGIAVPVVGITIGWTAGPTNPWTVGIGQSMAQLPMFSGIGYRLVVLLVLWAASLAYILSYAARIKKDPSQSLAANIDNVFNETRTTSKPSPSLSPTKWCF